MSRISGRAQPAIGAYGLELAGLEPAAAWMQAVPEGSPRLQVTVSAASEDHAPHRLTDREADIRVLGGGRMRMVRGENQVCFRFPVPTPPPPDILHPYLAPAAALTQLWAGREALHAGAFAGRSGAVLLLAGKGGGKSTTLAELAGCAGISVLADDLAVIEDEAVFAGPRCIDLRLPPDGADRKRKGVETVRGAARSRVRLPLAPSVVRIEAVVTLRWGPHPGKTVTPVAQRLAELLPHRMFRDRVDADHEALLGLIAVPWVTLTRPRGDDGLRAAVATLRGYA